MLDTVKINHVQHISFTQSRLTDAVSVILSELLSYEHPSKAGGPFLNLYDLCDQAHARQSIRSNASERTICSQHILDTIAAAVTVPNSVAACSTRNDIKHTQEISCDRSVTSIKIQSYLLLTSLFGLQNGQTGRPSFVAR